MNRRKTVIGILAIGVATAMRTAAQSNLPLPRVIVVSNGDEAGMRPYLDSFDKGMRELGQTDGSTYRLEVRHGNRDPSRVPALIREAVTTQPSVIVVAGLSAARAARDATITVPIVVTTSSDLVDAGIVSSFAHPGGNITGLNDLSDELAAKRLEILKEALPKVSRVVLLVNPDFPATPKIERRVMATARALRMEIIRVDAKDPASLVSALDSLIKIRPGAVLLGGDALFVVRAKELVERTLAMKIPLAHYWPGTAEMGALFSHQAEIFYNFRRAAYYVDRILKGAKPGDLPIEQPNKYELVINLRTAKTLGLTIPQSFLVRADRVIE